MTNDNTYTSPLVYVIAIFLAVHMLTFPFYEVPQLVSTGPSWYGLDVSWQMTLNYANIHNWIWGKDIIYTYGPLGFLSTRNMWGVSRWVFLAFDMLLVVNFFYVFKDFLKASASKLLGALVLVAAMLMMNTDHGTDLSIVLLFLVFFWLYKTYLQPSNASFAMLILLTVISFYIKMNTGLVGFCFLLVHLVLLYFADKISVVKALIIFASLTTAIVISAWLLHVHLPSYIISAFEIVKGYNDTMHMNNNETRHEDNLGRIYAMMKYLMLAYGVYILFKGKFMQFFFLGLCISYILIIKKQAYLRGDTQHLYEFFSYGPLILLMGNLLYFKSNTQKIITAFILFIITITLFFKTEYGRKIDEIFVYRFSNISNYFKEFSDSKNAQYIIQKDKRYIPDTVLRKIDKNTIDIFPWDTEYLIENKLNYHCRPLFQSFSAYTAYLQEKNYNFYVNNGPKYILFDYESIDGRYPFNDEAKLNMFILKNYTLSDTFTSNERLRSLLLRKKETQPLVISKMDERQFALTDNIPVIVDADFLKIDVALNFKGKKRAFSLRSPALDIQFTTQDGKTHAYKTSTELLKAGVMVQDLIENHQDFLSSINRQETNNKIIHVKLLADQAFFNKEITVEYYNIK